MAAPQREQLRLWHYLAPFVGALCFGAVMYAGMALEARDNPRFGLGYIAIGIAAVAAGRRLTTPYTLPSMAFYIFALCCIVFGGALIAAQA